MNEKVILKMVEPYLMDNVITYKNFDSLFDFLSLKEQYMVVEILFDHGIYVKRKDIDIVIDKKQKNKAVRREYENDKDIYDKKGISVASGWHQSSTDKYDINYQNTVIEVKTTTSDLYTVKVKHEQLFGRNDVVLAAVRVMESNAGETLEKIIAKINSIDVFAKDFSFQLKLGKELKRISPKEYKTKSVEIQEVRFYKNSDISTIRDIPDNITGIEYNCTLIETKETEIDDIICK